MENPNLTFVSPSIVIGDKSCTDVVIHEMVHSWSGNLITCENWECFWLNEGLTKFLEREAIRILYGEEIYELDTVIGVITSFVFIIRIEVLGQQLQVFLQIILIHR